jgi:hypothetical protein
LADSGHQLVGHEWAPRDEFLEICASMDIGLQVSFSETFNIVGADLISQGVPLVGSKEIPWASPIFNAEAQYSERIFYALHRTYKFPKLNVWHNQKRLNSYSTETRKIWVQYFTGEYQ